MVYFNRTDGKYSRTRKLTEEQVAEAILGSHSWDDDKMFAERFGVSPYTIRRIRTKVDWKEVRKSVCQDEKG